MAQSPCEIRASGKPRAVQGAAIFIDATVIRSVLLPASMKRLGPANWYLPSWLQWLPDIRMEEPSPGQPVES